MNYSFEPIKNSPENPIVCMTAVEGLARRLESHANTRTFYPGEKLFFQGTPINSIFVVMSGLVELAIFSNTGEKKTIAHCSKGIILGEMGLFQKYANSSEATVLERSRIVILPLEDLKKVFENDPELATLLFKSMITKLQLTTNQLAIMMLKSIPSRIAHILLDFRGSEVNLTHEELAAAVGCSRVTVTRHLGLLRDKGIIKNTKGKILIVDFQALNKYI